VRTVVPGGNPSSAEVDVDSDDGQQEESDDEEDPMADDRPDVWLVVGLGNPGPSYAGHRHNVGYLVVEELASRMGSPFRAHKTGRADVVEGRLAPAGAPGPRVVLAKSRSYMNEVGGPIKALATFYKVSPEHTVVIHDELDIDFGMLRVKLGGGDNGHNGLKSLRSSFGSGEFFRVRAGIGRPNGRQDVSDFVLSNYSTTERKELPFEVDRGADAVESLIVDGLEKTQQRFNS
jgi:PTH1 family peptidyl-tRNA hydrolase